MKTNPRLVWASNSRMIKTPSLIDVLRSTLERVEQSVKLTPDDPALREFKRHIPRMIAENRGNRKQPRPVVIMASHILWKTSRASRSLPVTAAESSRSVTSSAGGCLPVTGRRLNSNAQSAGSVIIPLHSARADVQEPRPRGALRRPGAHLSCRRPHHDKSRAVAVTDSRTDFDDCLDTETVGIQIPVPEHEARTRKRDARSDTFAVCRAPRPEVNDNGPRTNTMCD